MRGPRPIARVRAVKGEWVLLGIVFTIAETVLYYYGLVVLAAVIVSNLISFGVLDTRNRIVWTISDILYKATEPALRRIRNRMPNFGGIDFSPMVLLVIIWVLQAMLPRIYYALLGNLAQLFL